MEVAGLPRTVPFFGGMARVEVTDTTKKKGKKTKGKKTKTSSGVPLAHQEPRAEGREGEEGGEGGPSPAPATLQVKFLEYSKEKKKFIVDALSKSSPVLLPLAMVGGRAGGGVRLLHAQFASSMALGCQALYLVFVGGGRAAQAGDGMEVDAGEEAGGDECSVVAVDAQCRTLAVVAKFSLEEAGMEGLEQWKSGNGVCGGPSGLALVAGPGLLVWSRRQLVHLQWDEDLSPGTPGQLCFRRTALQSGSTVLLWGPLDPTSTAIHAVLTQTKDESGDEEAVLDDRCLASELIQSLFPSDDDVDDDSHTRVVEHWARAVAGARRFLSLSCPPPIAWSSEYSAGLEREGARLPLYPWFEVAGSFANVAECMCAFWSGHDQLFLLGTSFRQLICFKDSDVEWALSLPLVPARLCVSPFLPPFPSIPLSLSSPSLSLFCFSMNCFQCHFCCLLTCHLSRSLSLSHSLSVTLFHPLSLSPSLPLSLSLATLASALALYPRMALAKSHTTTRNHRIHTCTRTERRETHMALRAT